MALPVITPAYVRTFAFYNAEMNRRLYAAAGRLTDEQRREDRGAFFGSIHATFCHLLWGDRMWMSRLAGWDRPPGSHTESTRLVEAFDDLSRERVEVDAGLEAWAATLDEAGVAGELSWYSGVLGRDMTMSRGIVLAHMFNHQTHHRGQAHALLTGFGESTGGTDLVAITPAAL